MSEWSLSQQSALFALRFQSIGADVYPLSRVGDVVVAFRVFLFVAVRDHHVTLDRVVRIERCAAVAPRAVLEADIFIDGVFGLGHANPPKPNTELRRFLRICF